MLWNDIKNFTQMISGTCVHSLISLLSRQGYCCRLIDGSDIGLATAQQFVQEGAYVFIAGRRQNELDKAVKQIGKNVTGVQGDVSNLANLDRVYEMVKQQKGRIDVLFANAGIGEFVPSGSI
jgi:NAD(P)-dependent dehydrogenase (short-subunit alcohol dehydrogenase family)